MKHAWVHPTKNIHALLTVKLFGFSVVVHFTDMMSYMCICVYVYMSCGFRSFASTFYFPLTRFLTDLSDFESLFTMLAHTRMTNICAKFQWNTSTDYGASREIAECLRTTDGRTIRKWENMMLSCAYCCWRRHNNLWRPVSESGRW